MYRKTHSVYRFWYYARFHVSLGDPRLFPADKGELPYTKPFDLKYFIPFLVSKTSVFILYANIAFNIFSLPRSLLSWWHSFR